MSSSGKSSEDSTSILNSMIVATSSWISLENAPDSERDAERTASSVVASIRSAIASACARSIRSFRNALRVNSPGSAILRSICLPTWRQRFKSICSTTGPPCPWSSRTSSPVNECGALKYSAIPSSMMLPSSSMKGRKWAYRGSSGNSDVAFLKNSEMNGSRFLPEIRTMPTPPRPGAVAMAAIGEESVFIGNIRKNRFHDRESYTSSIILAAAKK